MATRLRDLRLGEERGSMLMEVMVSGMLLVIAAVGVFSAFDAAARSTAEERHRARAHSIAQADLSRMRTMRVSDLANLNQTWSVTQDGTVYTVTSRAEYQTDSTGTASCDSGTAAADYIKISSEVTWPSIGNRPTVEAATLVAPPNGSVLPNRGSLAVGVENSQNVGIPGVGLSGTGAGSFSGVTGDNGCAVFGNLPAGNYTLTVSGVAAGLVDPNGLAPAPQSTSVVAEGTNTLVLQYDSPGSIPVRFQTKSYTNVNQAAQEDKLLVFNTGMTAARTFGTIGSPLALQTATNLFPFPSPYSVYAGSCVGDNPNPQELVPPPAPGALAAVTVTPGTAMPQVTLQLPAFHLTVYTGTDTSSSRANGATVKVRDLLCFNLLRTLTTNSSGRLADPGLPYTEYSVCVQTGTGGSAKHKIPYTPAAPLSLNEPSDITGGTAVNVFMGSGTTTGACP